MPTFVVINKDTDVEITRYAAQQPVEQIDNLAVPFADFEHTPLPEMPAPQVIVRPTPERAPVAWQFDFVRNADGTIQSIKATPAS